MKLNNIFLKNKKRIVIIKGVIKEKGFFYVMRAVINWLAHYTVLDLWHKLSKSPKTFIFQGQTYNYFYHPHRQTWKSERAIEIPIIWELVKGYQGRNILEVGNVLAHYLPINHQVLDKYEKGGGIINEDVVDFQPAAIYDLIVSISTLEHIGWEERPYDGIINYIDWDREPTKILKAVDNLKKMLSPGGRLVATIPLGWNPEMDRLLKENKIPFTKKFYLKRISLDNKWQEVDWTEVSDAKYHFPFTAANGLVVGIIEKD